MLHLVLIGVAIVLTIIAAVTPKMPLWVAVLVLGLAQLVR